MKAAAGLLCLLGLAAAASAQYYRQYGRQHRRRSRGPQCFKQSGVEFGCGHCGEGECVRRPRNICLYKGMRGGECPEEICMPSYRHDPCALGGCPAGDTCRVVDHEPVCDADACAPVPGAYGCRSNEVCVPRRKRDKHQCVMKTSQSGAVFDGRNANGVFVPCTSDGDCRDWCEPPEWFCCHAGRRRRRNKRGHNWGGAKCDGEIGGCVVERRDAGRRRWTLVQRKVQARNCNCRKVCPCCG